MIVWVAAKRSWLHIQLHFRNERFTIAHQRRAQRDRHVEWARKLSGTVDDKFTTVVLRCDCRLGRDQTMDVRRGDQRQLDGAFHALATLDAHGNGYRLAGNKRVGSALDFQRELARTDDGDELFILAHGAERYAMLRAVRLLENAHAHDADAARASRFHPRRQIRGVGEFRYAGGNRDRRSLGALQVPGLAIGKADLDRAFEAIAFDLVFALMHAATGGKTHVVFTFDDEWRLQCDGEQYTRLFQHPTTDFEFSNALYVLRFADDGQSRQADLREDLRMD